MSAPLVGGGGGAALRKANLNNPESDLFDHAPIDDVVLATAGYDHTIKFWQPHTGT